MCRWFFIVILLLAVVSAQERSYFIFTRDIGSLLDCIKEKLSEDQSWEKAPGVADFVASRVAK